MLPTIRTISACSMLLCGLLLAGCGKKAEGPAQAPTPPPRPAPSTIPMIVNAQIQFPASVKGLRPDEVIAVVVRWKGTGLSAGTVYYSLAPSDTTPVPCWKKPGGCPNIVTIDVLMPPDGGATLDEVVVGAEVQDLDYRDSNGETGRMTPLGYFGGRIGATGKVKIVDSPAKAVGIPITKWNPRDTLLFDMR